MRPYELPTLDILSLEVKLQPGSKIKKAAIQMAELARRTGVGSVWCQVNDQLWRAFPDGSGSTTTFGKPIPVQQWTVMGLERELLDEEIKKRENEQSHQHYD